MKPILEAITQANLTFMEDTEDGDAETHLAELQSILIHGVAFETLIDHDGHVVSLTTVGLSYKYGTEMSFSFAPMVNSNLSLLTMVETMKFTMVKAIEDKANILDRLNGLEYISVVGDDVGVRINRPNQFSNPCYGGEEYKQVAHNVTIRYTAAE